MEPDTYREPAARRLVVRDHVQPERTWCFDRVTGLLTPTAAQPTHARSAAYRFPDGGGAVVFSIDGEVYLQIGTDRWWLDDVDVAFTLRSHWGAWRRFTVCVAGDRVFDHVYFKPELRAVLRFDFFYDHIDYVFDDFFAWFVSVQSEPGWFARMASEDDRLGLRRP